jgi:hypothetical protein
VTSAGLVLAGTFGVFAVLVGGQPGGTVYRDILASLAIGILMDASSSARCSSRPRSRCSAGGTGGRPPMASARTWRPRRCR